jgi:hypothetical protein
MIVTVFSIQTHDCTSIPVEISKSGSDNLAFGHKNIFVNYKAAIRVKAINEIAIYNLSSKVSRNCKAGYYLNVVINSTVSALQKFCSNET